MGLGSSENKIYLQVGYGKLRKKTNTPGEGIVERLNKDGEKIYAYEYKFIEGKITGIYYKESKDYGNSFEITIKDDRLYNVSLKENSRYCQDFLSKLPAINLNKEVRLTPYEMAGDDDKTFRGISVLQDGVKIQNFFIEKDGEERVYKHGFPKPNAKKLSEKQWKIYCIEMQDFLMKYAINEILPSLKDLKNKHEESDITDEPAIDEATDDDSELPF